MPRQSISLTEPNAQWVKAQIESKEHTNTSDAVNDVIRQIRRQEEQKIEKIRIMLIEAEESVERYGYSQKTVHEIWEAAKQNILLRMARFELTPAAEQDLLNIAYFSVAVIGITT